MEDYDFWIRAYRTYRFKHLSNVLYKYRIHENSLSTKKRMEIIERTKKIWIRELENAHCAKEDQTKLLYSIISYIYIGRINRGELRKYLRLLKKISLDEYEKLPRGWKLSCWLPKSIAERM